MIDYLLISISVQEICIELHENVEQIGSLLMSKFDIRKVRVFYRFRNIDVTFDSVRIKAIFVCHSTSNFIYYRWICQFFYCNCIKSLKFQNKENFFITSTLSRNFRNYWRIIGGMFYSKCIQNIFLHRMIYHSLRYILYFNKYLIFLTVHYIEEFR